MLEAMRATIAVALLLTATACAREEKLVDRFVEKYCEARWSCGCESPGLTQVHCESMLTNAGEEAQEAAQEAGLEYDRECAKAWLDAIDDSCSVQATQQDGGCEPCAPYHGNKREGEACQEFGPWSDCAGDLRCGLGGMCEDPCHRPQEGDSCASDVGGNCGPDLICVQEACAPAPALGEPCIDACRSGATCDLDQELCVEPPGFGEPCSGFGTCGPNLQCDQTEDGMEVCDVASPKVCSLGTPW
jgi:hypothetical protein